MNFRVRERFSFTFGVGVTKMFDKSATAFRKQADNQNSSTVEQSNVNISEFV